MKLQAMRKAKGLSQSQLAEMTGLNVRTLQHYEQGSKCFDNANMNTILKVCLALECKIEDVVENPRQIELLKEYEKSTQD